MIGPRTGSFDYYRGKYFIVFYDDDDETPLHSFDNVRQILDFQGKPITRTNVNLVNVELYRALRRDSHSCEFLTGKKMRVYIIDVNEE